MHYFYKKLHHNNKLAFNKFSLISLIRHNSSINNDNMSISNVSKHHPFANKEWRNSVYCYNRPYLLNLPGNDELANNVIKSYFNLANSPKITTKSKRMRDLLRRSSTKKIFVSKTHIKQTSDKVIITVYTFDRESHHFKRKLFFLLRWFKKNNTFTLVNNHVYSLKDKKALINLREKKKSYLNVLKKITYIKNVSILNKKAKSKLMHVNSGSRQINITSVKPCFSRTYKRKNVLKKSLIRRKRALYKSYFK